MMIIGLPRRRFPGRRARSRPDQVGRLDRIIAIFFDDGNFAYRLIIAAQFVALMVLARQQKN